VPFLVKTLQDHTLLSDHREAAARVLAKIGPDAKDAIPALIDALKAARLSSERLAMIGALTNIGPAAPEEVVPVLAATVRAGPFHDERMAALGGLKVLKPEAKEVVPALAEALQTVRFSAERQAIIDYLATFGPDASAAVPALVGTLRSGLMEDRVAAARCLGGMGPAAEDAVPALVQMAERGPFVADREAAQEALKKIRQNEERPPRGPWRVDLSLG
jgi:HEAT repeat protein